MTISNKSNKMKENGLERVGLARARERSSEMVTEGTRDFGLEGKAAVKVVS